MTMYASSCFQTLSVSTKHIYIVEELFMQLRTELELTSLLSTHIATSIRFADLGDTCLNLLL